jgi:hypothetical protein
MPSRGVLFALSSDQEARLLSASGNDEVMEAIEEIEEAWDEPNLAQTDKAWDAIHRALTDGQLELDDGDRPLNQVILGGRSMYDGDDYIAVYKNPTEVKEIAAALASIPAGELARRYWAVVPREYAPEYGDEDLAYTVEWYEGVASLYRIAAEADRAVLFTVGQ